MRQNTLQREENNSEEIQNEIIGQKSYKRETIIALIYPYLISLILALVSIATFSKTLVLKIEKDLANPILTLSAILIAFVATSMTIVLASLGLKAVKYMQTFPGVMKIFIGYHTQAIWMGMATCGMSLIAIIVADKPLNILHWLFFFIWSFCFFSSIITFVRVVHLLHRILCESV